MVSSPTMSPAFVRQHVKFGHVEHAATPTPIAHQEESVKKPEIAKPVTIVEIGIEPQKAAQAAAKESIGKSALKEFLTATLKVPAQVIPIIVGIAAPFIVDKFLDKYRPKEAVETIEAKMKEAKLIEKAKELGKTESKLMGMAPLLLIGGGFFTKLGEKAGEKLIEVPVGFILSKKAAPISDIEKAVEN